MMSLGLYSNVPGESCTRSNAYNTTVTHLIAYLRDSTGLYGEAHNCAYYAAKRAASLRVNILRATNHHYCMHARWRIHKRNQSNNSIFGGMHKYCSDCSLTDTHLHIKNSTGTKTIGPAQTKNIRDTPLSRAECGNSKCLLLLTCCKS